MSKWQGIEVVFQNTPRNKELLKDNKGKKALYSDTVISIRFYYCCEFYYEFYQECLNILKTNNIPYIEVSF